MKNKICGDCLEDITRHYVLTAETWNELQSKIPPDNETEYACAACVEETLGRKLEPSDFNPDAAVNYASGFLGVEKSEEIH